MLVFIISWAGQHDNARLIAVQAARAGARVTIVYSDPGPHEPFDLSCALVRRPNDLFWEDKFQACLEAAGGEGFLVIHADCRCDDWERLVRRCGAVATGVRDLGVWAPQIHGTHLHLGVSGILKISGGGLVAAALTDGIIFYLAPAIVARMARARYGQNRFGWGIAALFCAAAHVAQRLVVIDTSVQAFHPADRKGYDAAAAKAGMDAFIQQFSWPERLQFELLLSHVNYRRALGRDRAPVKGQGA